MSQRRVLASHGARKAGRMGALSGSHKALERRKSHCHLWRPTLGWARLPLALALGVPASPLQEDREDEFDVDDQFNPKKEAERVFQQFDWNKDGTISSNEMATWFLLADQPEVEVAVA